MNRGRRRFLTAAKLSWATNCSWMSSSLTETHTLYLYCSSSFSMHTCEVIKPILLEDFIHKWKKLPHLWWHLLAGQAMSQGQDLLIKFWEGKESRVTEGKHDLFIVNRRADKVWMCNAGGMWKHEENWLCSPRTCCCSTVPITCRQMPSSCWVICKKGLKVVGNLSTCTASSQSFIFTVRFTFYYTTWIH